MRNLFETGDQWSAERPGHQILTPRCGQSADRITPELKWMRNDGEVIRFLRNRFTMRSIPDWPQQHITEHCHCSSCRQRRTAALWFWVIQAYFRAGECAEKVAEAYNATLPGAMREYVDFGGEAPVAAVYAIGQRDPSARTITPTMVRRVAQQIRLAVGGHRLDGKTRTNGKRGRKSKKRQEIE